MTDPSTPDEWQEAVDAAKGALALHAAFQYGLIERQRVGGADDGATLTESGVDVERCDEILVRGAALGYVPASDSVERFMAEVTRK